MRPNGKCPQGARENSFVVAAVVVAVDMVVGVAVAVAVAVAAACAVVALCRRYVLRYSITNLLVVTGYQSHMTVFLFSFPPPPALSPLPLPTKKVKSSLGTLPAGRGGTLDLTIKQLGQIDFTDLASLKVL